MDTIIPITDLQQKTRKYVQQVRDTGKPLVITQRGRAAVVIFRAEEYESFRATMDEMSYPDWKERIERAERDLDAGLGITLEAYMKKRAKKLRRA